MNILVCVKQVSVDEKMEEELLVDSLDCGDGLVIVNPCDGNAITAAVKIKEDNPDAEIIIVWIGEDRVKETVRSCFAHISSKVYMVSECVPGWNSAAELSRLVNDISKKIEKMEGKIDLTFCEGLTK